MTSTLEAADRVVPSRRPTLVLAILFAIAVVTVRLPLVPLGYGSDDDSYRNVVGVLHSLASGHYAPSRLPGFPLFDLVLVALLPFGAAAINLAAAAAQTVAVLLLWRIAIRLGIAAPWLPAVALAFAPGFWVSATQAMDYAFGIAVVLGAYLALLEGRGLLAGALVALAAGFRPTHALFGIPALMLLAMRGRSARQTAAFALTAAIGGVLVFGPVLAAVPMAHLRSELVRHVARDHARASDLVALARTDLPYLFGKLGTVLAAVAIAWMLVRSRRSDSRRWEAAPIVAECVAVGVYTAFFLAIPYEPAYLLPALPFALLLLARLLAPRWLAAIAIATASEALALPLVSERRVVPGRLALEIADRRALLDETARLRAEVKTPGQVLVVDRFNVLRLVALAPDLERTNEAWTAFWGDGVALWGARHASGFAARLSAGRERALRAAGYRIVRPPP
jgi:hypothetical protein